MPSKNKRKQKRRQNKTGINREFVAAAPEHANLIDDAVHVFVDDQNLFYGITNQTGDRGYRIDFGNLLRVAAQSTQSGHARAIKSAYIAGVIPDDDSFWQAARNQGFTVYRGFLSQAGRSRQDDAYLITSIMQTLYEKEGPSTMVIIAGDADYEPPLKVVLEKQWRIELAFSTISGGISNRLSGVVHEYREFSPEDIEKIG